MEPPGKAQKLMKTGDTGIWRVNQPEEQPPRRGWGLTRGPWSGSKAANWRLKGKEK